MSSERAAEVEKLEERKNNGEQLTGREESLITMGPEPPWTRRRTVRRVVPQSLQEEFGDDWDAYITYYTENRPYLHPVDSDARTAPLRVDEDARSLGIANDDIALLETCVALLETDNDVERARRLLARYTDETFDSAEKWRTWLNTHRERIFFTEVGGFKFMVSPNPVAKSPVAKNPVAAIEVPRPTADRPVRVNAALIPRDGSKVDLVVKARILGGWHIYSYAPPGQPYIVTTLKIEGKGLKPVGDWKRPRAERCPDLAGVTIFTGDVVFEHALETVPGATTPVTAKVTIGYQACDPTMCFPPMTAEFELTLK